MKCNECDYKKDYTDTSGISKVRCTITNEVYEAGSECSCRRSRLIREEQRQIEELMNIKYNDMSARAVDAGKTLAALRKKIEHGGEFVNIYQVYTLLKEVVADGVTSEKLNDVIEYLEGFIELDENG
jgi:hypothetical protein